MPGASDELWYDLNKYERATLTLRVDEREAVALLSLLVECDRRDRHKADAVLLADRLAHEIENFQAVKRGRSG
jgi:hypothetical protein